MQHSLKVELLRVALFIVKVVKKSVVIKVSHFFIVFFFFLKDWSATSFSSGRKFINAIIIRNSLNPLPFFLHYHMQKCTNDQYFKY